MKTRGLCTALAVVISVMVHQPASAATANVSISEGLRFTPADITVNVGDTVRWSNDTFLIHTVTSGDNCIPDGSWTSGNLDYLDSFQRVFDAPGVFPYHCSVPGHCSAGMRGTVTVIDAGPPPNGGGVQLFPYHAADTAKSASEASRARPVGIGSVADGGATLDVTIRYPAFGVPQDVYFALLAPVPLGTDELFVLDGDSIFQPASTAGIVPWAANTTGPIDSSLFGPISVSALPAGTYTLFSAISDAGGGSGALTIWQTEFVVGREVVITTPLAGNEQVPDPVVTGGTGTGTILVNLDSGELSGRVSFSGLTAPTLFAHIHGGAVGANGPVVITLQGGEGVTEGTFEVPPGTILGQADLVALTNGLLYYNIHTATNSGGELRGQIAFPQDPLTVVTALNGDRQLPGIVETAGSGRGVLTLDQATGEISAYLAFRGLTSNTLFAHIHEQNAGSGVGPVLIPLDGGDEAAAGAYTIAADTVLAADKTTALVNGTLYFNIHTQQHSGGEIRGQIIP